MFTLAQAWQLRLIPMVAPSISQIVQSIVEADGDVRLRLELKLVEGYSFEDMYIVYSLHEVGRRGQLIRHHR